MTDRPIVEAEALLGLERDVLVLTAEERRWGRRRARTAAGRELALALPTGSVLAPGEVLHVDRDWYVVVEAAREAVLAVVPAIRSRGLRAWRSRWAIDTSRWPWMAAARWCRTIRRWSSC